ncbi:MAG: alginate export family protein [Acidobacteria bacterium]|nr:alginate export family protein [Acidobacteriota bacterium]
MLRPAYQPNAANEDWSALKNPANRTDWWDWAKYIPFGNEGFVTLSSEIRFRPEGFRLKGSETLPSVRDNYLLQRYLFGADVRLGPRVRVFTEFQSGIINGKIGATRPTDQNTFDLHQAFFEWRRRPGQDKRFNLRIGRQELTIGSSRLISASPGLNTKRSFDGARLVFGSGSWTVEGAVALLTEMSKGVLDDDPLRGVKFWGVAAARPSPRWVKGLLVLYYLGVKNDDARFAQGLGRDLRHTFGVSWRGSGPHLDLNYDVIFQAGSFNDVAARAWAVSTETGHGFSKTRWSPRLSVRFNSASGDHDAADPHLQSFNPLFPGSSYAGIVGLFGPTNMTDVTPTITVTPRKNFILGFEQPNYWRSSTGDGLYNVNLQVMARPTAGTGRYVGSSFNIFTVWQARRHLQITGAIMRMQSGGFLERTIAGKGLGLYSISTIYRF